MFLLVCYSTYKIKTNWAYALVFENNFLISNRQFHFATANIGTKRLNQKAKDGRKMRIGRNF